ncbi:MAG: F0F1 ATP synthase subunit A [Planctomycetota bacterium]
MRVLLAMLVFAAIGYGLGALGSHGHTPTMEMEDSEFFDDFYSHLVPHELFGGHGDDVHGDAVHGDAGEGHEGHSEGEGSEGEGSEVGSHDGEAHGSHADGGDGGHGRSLLTFYDVNLWQVISVLLMFAIFLQVLASFRSGANSWFIRVFRGWCRWIRDEMVAPAMSPEDTKTFTPFFIYMFFFIAFANVLGMLPNGTTATATIFVTGTLAMVTFAVMIFGGMKRQGAANFWKNLIPHGLPVFLVPLLAVLEVVGLLVKPFALAIRLFANMLAGHLVLYSFIALIFLIAKGFEMSAGSYAIAVLPVGMAVFISVIEAFVALLQAYIFTLLSITFIQAALHPEH